MGPVVVLGSDIPSPSGLELDELVERVRPLASAILLEVTSAEQCRAAVTLGVPLLYKGDDFAETALGAR